MGLLKPTEDMTTMKEQPTPETDALAGEWIACECVPVSHSRKLERERDEARAKLANVYLWIERNHPDGFIDSQSHFQNLERVTDHIHDKMDKLERERDEALARLDSEKSTRNAIIAQGVELEKQLEAMREVLRTIREEAAKIFSATAGLPDCGLIHRVAAAAQDNRQDLSAGWMNRLCDEVNTLRTELESEQEKALVWFIAYQELKTAVADTLDENGHLADGDQCTLKKLKDAYAKAQSDETRLVPQNTDYPEPLSR